MVLFGEFANDTPNHSPVRAQYLKIKSQHPDAILFFRMGDFYEMFDDDAEIVARELEIALTRRDFGRGQKSPMAGVPHHAADGYIARLVGKGYRVAVCEQTSDPALSRGLVDREVVRVVTPGTVIDPTMLAAKRNNFLAAVVLGRNAVGIAYIDITTGEFAVTQFNTPEPELAIQQEISRVGPAEVLVEANYSRLGSRKKRWLATVLSEKQVTKLGSNGDPNATIPELDEDDDEDDYAPLVKLLNGLAGHITPYDSRYFAEDDARHRLLKQFDVSSLEGFGCDQLPLAIRAAGAVLAYVQETQKGLLQQLTSLETYSTSSFMTLDPYTRRNLELFETGRSGTTKGSLLWVLDKTRTPMGGRLLRRWLGQPLLNIQEIQTRQETVQVLLQDTLLQAQLGEALKKAGDLERLINRVRQRIASPRDLVALANGLRAASEVRHCLAESSSATVAALQGIMQRLSDNGDIIELIEHAIVEDPPVSITEGGIIRAGFSPELDKLRDASVNGRRWLSELEQRERKRTGITNLKVGFNKAYGYFIEVTKSNLDRVPADYQRRQTLTNCERYITSELKEQEALILNAQERINRMENEFFVQLRSDIAVHASERILDTAHAVAELDVYLSLAEIAAKNNYCRPIIDESDTIHIVAGRHPVVEQTQSDTAFIPNDTDLSISEGQIAIITGPNMAGKSTYLRQVALITLLAQIGSFVPAESARIGIVDRIFTRIGAQDDLATGQSTFMVEMVETANILHHATQRSLIILDEIGRGTSTYDGLAIARAVVEYLHNNRRSGARTLFATHYHELVEVSRILPRVRCLNVAVAEEEGKVIFLRKIVPGGADRSYGIHVAQLAGLPRPVIHRAEEILAELEQKGDAKSRRKAMRDLTMPQAWQMTLFAPETHPVVEELKNLAIDELTPIEAISKLYELQQKANKEHA
ncbi:DNA mismatch repair protein MutS [Thermosporothrix hazakensis]|jgi:DNA mismatch repair protein MutS|uniref:DNA mismatch repair protein MutS n=2 Tax=Thermosporothrix TaxID=768650 RepID=A0A326UES4_THEHA|nr:DNA mismatch repair protein MutS [Thermosporothrix hazakensis]PZW36425.1 DNA mismatch repair protein MutS [Thermosporothrix hazakensis]BBH88892.1 DNA mismatch repair protein MutS [Thermosporothrix sp. COM3]GCE47077.1 DNA mismatch repair protein MutS [Thermosporothrix hazakensis]